MNLQITDEDLLDGGTLYRRAEVKANQFNLRGLLVLGGFSVLCEFLNNAGIFVVSKGIMHICSALGLLGFLFPVLVWLVHDRILERKRSILTWRGFKYLILVSIYLGIGIYSVLLTFHAVILLALPPIFAAQYSDQKHMLYWTLTGGVLVVLAGVFGGCLIGIPDRNFFAEDYVKSGFVSNSMTLEDRLSLFDAKLFRDLLFFYAVPRIFGVVSFSVLLSGISGRSGTMLSRQATLAGEVNREMERRNETLSKVIEDMATLIETRDIRAVEHVANTKQMVKRLARMLMEDGTFPEPISERDIEMIEMAAPLHDIGKIAVSDTILLKPDKLTPEEFDIVKTHTTRGAEMIRKIFFDLDYSELSGTAVDIVLYHHERWDGTGYPEGLSGRDIPLSARIMAVADVYDALISDRPYKRAMSGEDALQLIYSESGSHFDPDIIRIMREKLTK